MKIAIISDIHDNLENLKTCLDYCAQNKIDELICCGDLTNDHTLKFLATNFSNKIYIIKGNCDFCEPEDYRLYNNINFLGRYNILIIDNQLIGLCHEPEYIDSLLAQEKCQHIFYGHTHKPWEETRQTCHCLNPGNISNTYYRPTFAVWDTSTNNFELQLI